MDEILTKEFMIRYLCDLSYYKRLNKCARLREGRYRAEEEELRPLILKRQSIIKQAINKVKKENYRQILTMRYIYGFKWCKIVKTLFKNETDFEIQKDYKYRDKAFYWHRQALKALRKTNREEYTAIQILKKIKKICNKYTTCQHSQDDKVIINTILALIWI